MKKMLLFLLVAMMAACSYDEDFTLYSLTVTLVYPENSTGPYEGARVELKSNTGTIYIDSTNANGTVTYQVPPGIYEASTSEQFIDSTGTTWWRYNYNGVKSMIVVDADSLNQAEVTLKMSRKRIVQ